ncbi:MAG: hypothetical protein M5R36_25225 [Deltaproteobacteria bacterium]|nr:hypothetical protein [Deltaproteobacteria bacterium]
MRWRKMRWAACALAVIVAAAACSAAEEFNDAASQTRDFSESMNNIFLIEIDAVCPPAPVTFNELFDVQDWWADAEAHIESVEVTDLNYKVFDNESPVELSVDFYLSDVTDPAQLSEADYLASTDVLPPEWKVANWKPMTLAPDAPDRMTDLFLSPDTPFTLCAKVPQVGGGTATTEQVRLSLGVQIAGTITVKPIAD